MGLKEALSQDLVIVTSVQRLNTPSKVTVPQVEEGVGSRLFETLVKFIRHVVVGGGLFVNGRKRGFA